MFSKRLPIGIRRIWIKHQLVKAHTVKTGGLISLTNRRHTLVLKTELKSLALVCITTQQCALVMQFTQLIRDRRLILKGSNYKTTLQLVGSFGNEARSSEAKYLITLSAAIFTLFYKKRQKKRVYKESG